MRSIQQLIGEGNTAQERHENLKEASRRLTDVLEMFEKSQPFRDFESRILELARLDPDEILSSVPAEGSSLEEQERFIATLRTRRIARDIVEGIKRTFRDEFEAVKDEFQRLTGKTQWQYDATSDEGGPARHPRVHLRYNPHHNP